MRLDAGDQLIMKEPSPAEACMLMLIERVSAMEDQLGKLSSSIAYLTEQFTSRYQSVNVTRRGPMKVAWESTLQRIVQVVKGRVPSLARMVVVVVHRQEDDEHCRFLFVSDDALSDHIWTKDVHPALRIALPSDIHFFSWSRSSESDFQRAVDEPSFAYGVRCTVTTAYDRASV
jgi:hypothetical protein